MQYLIVKHSHMFFVAVTILLFNIRFFLLRARPDKPLAPLWKALPHMNDTLLLFTGLWLLKITHLSPFATGWLGVKLLLLLAYIAAGMVMMRAKPRSPKFYATYVLAMVCVLAIVYLARMKPF
ncbi:SirB2 family protein [Neisseria sp.]|uniref:SirB2 family protein n=1 Tax=Neisseria sp. TaxID=192066 RepID=UPI0035A04221